MKLLKYVSILLPVFFVASCNDWLDLNPSESINDDKLFEDYRGFRNSLNGIYTSLASPSVYGRELTWGLNSALGQDYIDVYAGSVYRSAMRFEFEEISIKNKLTSVWAESYKIIANCNKLIEEVEKRDSSFFPYGEMERSLILGEALGVRALLHFEMLRLFSSAPTVDKTGRYIPYREEYNVDIVANLTNEDVIEKVTGDLLLAKDLVAINDTIVNRSFCLNSGVEMRFERGTDAKGGVFFGYRGTRLNYVAITGLLARVYLYAGDYDKAEKYARYVYDKYSPDAERENEGEGWTFSRSSGVNIKLIDDALMALSDKNLFTKVTDFITYDNGRSQMYLNGIRGALQPLDESDIRFKSIMVMEGNNERCVKWGYDEVSTEIQGAREYQLIPVIRLSEMYYTLAECCYRDGRMEEALEFLTQIRTNREEARAITVDDIEIELIRETRKEYVMEGQTFFMFKRWNVPIIIGDYYVDARDKYVLPIPAGENI